ncbi:MAG: glycosyltransferase family 4 protein [Chitinophagaceae bacterium]
MKVLVAHPGTQYSHQLVKQLEQRGLLYRFYTGFAMAQGSRLHRLFSLLPQRVQKKLSNRIITGVPAHKVRPIMLPEAKSLYKLSKGASSEAVFYERNKKFQEAIPDSALKACDVVIGFDTSSWILQQRCRALGKKFILDVSIAHPLSKRAIYAQIAAAYPDWKFALKDKSDQLVAIEQQEMEQADVIAVASSFSRHTLIENNVSPSKIAVNGYGVHAGDFLPAEKQQGGPVKFVFVGLVDARKGIPLLLDAWEGTRHAGASLTLIGPVETGIRELIATRYPGVIVKGKLPFAELKKELPLYDAMVFPSYFEGFGLVVPEAMACGLPVITTSATCGPDVMEDGVEGRVIPAGNIDRLRQALQEFIDNRDRLGEMSRHARAKALQHTWEAYGARWEQLIRQTLAG